MNTSGMYSTLTPVQPLRQVRSQKQSGEKMGENISRLILFFGRAWFHTEVLVSLLHFSFGLTHLQRGTTSFFKLSVAHQSSGQRGGMMQVLYYSGSAQHMHLLMGKCLSIFEQLVPTQFIRAISLSCSVLHYVVLTSYWLNLNHLGNPPECPRFIGDIT